MNAKDDELCWYVGYGSNLDWRRFMTYIKGGAIPGGSHHHEGSRDPREPIRIDTHVLKDRRLVFRQYSSWWGGKVCSIVKEDGNIVHTRCYLITRAQFEDVVKQENSRAVQDVLRIDYDLLHNNGQTILFPDAGYGLLLHVGTKDGHPMYSFTHPPNHTQDDDDGVVKSSNTMKMQDSFEVAVKSKKAIVPNRTASAPYLKTLARGLRGHISHDELVLYLHSCEGITDHWTQEQIKELIVSLNDESFSL
jgi:hypothetical protein